MATPNNPVKQSDPFQAWYERLYEKHQMRTNPYGYCQKVWLSPAYSDLDKDHFIKYCARNVLLYRSVDTPPPKKGIRARWQRYQADHRMDHLRIERPQIFCELKWDEMVRKTGIEEGKQKFITDCISECHSYVAFLMWQQRLNKTWR